MSKRIPHKFTNKKTKTKAIEKPSKKYAINKSKRNNLRFT